MSNPLILIVDDDPVNRLVTKTILIKQGFDTIEAADGPTAISLFSQTVNLILMDISMPGMDGLQATKKIRELSDTGAKVPILAFTAHAFDCDKQRFLEAGMNSYITKPVRGAQLTSIVREYCQ